MTNQDQREGYRGYIGSRLYSGQRVPQHVQNLVIRDYAKRQNLQFLLSLTEYCMEDCYMMLQDAVMGLTQYKGLIFYSLVMLPASSAERMKIYRQVLAAQGEIHAALEDITIRSEADIREAEEILQVHHIMLKNQRT